MSPLVPPARCCSLNAAVSCSHNVASCVPPSPPTPQMSVAVIESLSLMRASVEEEMVVQSTLGVPAHHALTCRIQVYGSPFT